MGFTKLQHLVLRIFFRCFIPLSTFMFVGCTVLEQTTTYSLEEFIDAVSAEDAINVARVQVDLADSGLSLTTVSELNKYGQQVEALLDQPLRLGSLGSAILDRLEFSYAGHLAMQHFYQYFEHEHADVHKAELENIVTYMTAAGDGSLERPYRALTSGDALLFVQQSGYRVIGSIYVKTNAEPMVLRVMRLREEPPYEEVYFDLSPLYPVLITALDSVGSAQDPLVWTELLARMASMGDSAAQLSLGRLFASRREVQQAERLFLSASQANNGYAHMLYANLFLDEAFNSRARNTERFLQIAQSHYSQAIDYGFQTAFRQLGILLFEGQFGEGMRPRGKEMLERAASFDDTIALRYLGEIFRFGHNVEVDFNRSAEFYERAAKLGDRRARIEYYRVLVHPEASMELTEQAIDWLSDSANGGDPMAMLELGNCYIRGCGTKPNYRRALRWYRKAVQTDPNHPEVVNSIAWTLAVSDNNRYRDPDYALKIIEHLMENDEESRNNPMIVDTWAAVHAALGHFERAIELQIEALEIAKREQRDPELFNVLQIHLNSFLKGAALSESVP